MKMNKTTLSTSALILLSCELSSLVMAKKDASSIGRKHSLRNYDWSTWDVNDKPYIRRRILGSKKSSKKGGSSKKSSKKGGSDDDEDVCDPNKCYLVKSREDIKDKCPKGDPIVNCEPVDEPRSSKKGSSSSSSKNGRSGKKGDMLPETGFACTCETPPPTAPPTTTPTPNPTLTPEDENKGITCISVIDEASNFDNSGFETQWTQFRTDYEDRKFCLLQPQDSGDDKDDLNIPTAFDTDGNTIYSVVARDGGTSSLASDWFSICNLDGLRSQGFTNIAYFIDNSGSMTTSTVQASLDLLNSKLAAVGITLVAGIENSAEDWVSPFLTDFL